MCDIQKTLVGAKALTPIHGQFFDIFFLNYCDDPPLSQLIVEALNCNHYKQLIVPIKVEFHIQSNSVATVSITLKWVTVD